MAANSLRNRIYYRLRPLIPRQTQVWLRSRYVRQIRQANANVWPILESAGSPPKGWPGWPEQRHFAFVIAHDVELAIGQSRVLKLMQMEEELGFRSSFNLVPERYAVDPEIRSTLTNHGFEVGVHGLLHDGKLFDSRSIFLERAKRINMYLKDWQSVGFYSPSSHHQLEWMHDLDIEYDSSTFDTDPFEPQPDGLQTIFPVWVPGESPNEGFVELPYTLPQDYTLFVLLGEKTNEVWKQKVRWIAKKGGLAFVIAHPDYMCFDGSSPNFQEYPVGYYQNFLEHVRTTYEGQYWNALPREVASYFRAHVGAADLEPRGAYSS